MDRNLKRFWKAYNEYSKSDRNAILILGFLILISVAATVVVKNIQPKSKYNYSDFEELITQWENQKIDEEGKKLFAFNPNTINSETLDSLDLPENIKRNILNYRKAGGKFYKPGQVRKIYGMNDSIFDIIEEYIVISVPPENMNQEKNKANEHIADISTQFKQGGKNVTDARKEPTVSALPDFAPIELNSADSADLVKLYGIGTVFAKRILKYRDLLGGFYSVSQLLEVYNFPEETFQKIENNILVDTLLLKKIRLNFAEYPDLIRHPYLDQKQVNAILKFREKNGSFYELEQVTSNGLVDSGTFLKLRPYLTCR
ncbi:MAG: DNA uptake protein and related DNA-binding [Prolixibacteraceae bacterium]|nr:MAG: DNA uptake protein and related DNA-binding [Prolixibacteraceae bacterium]